MTRWIDMVCGFIIGTVVLAACAQAPYRYYGISMPDACYDHGKLLGRQGGQGWPDLPMTACKPDEAIKGKCVLILASQFYSGVKALRECQTQLITCQKGPAPQ